MRSDTGDMSLKCEIEHGIRDVRSNIGDVNLKWEIGHHIEDVSLKWKIEGGSCFDSCACAFQGIAAAWSMA